MLRSVDSKNMFAQIRATPRRRWQVSILISISTTNTSKHHGGRTPDCVHVRWLRNQSQSIGRRTRETTGNNTSWRTRFVFKHTRMVITCFQHALGLSTHGEPEAQFGFLSDTFRVLVFDNRGSGRSDKKRPYTHAQWIADVDELRYVALIFISAELTELRPGNGPKQKSS